MKNREKTNLKKIIIIGSGFAGLYAARSMKHVQAEITLIDKRNFHLFQPLLYQVATGAVSSGDIAVPIRHVFYKQKNIRVIKDEVLSIDTEKKSIKCRRTVLGYDILIVASGMQKHYYGNNSWEKHTLGLKTLEDAVSIRNHLLKSFENAETIKEPDKKEQILTFVVIGAGPSGVELAGAIAELANHTLKRDYRTFDPGKSRIVLIEASDRILPAMPEKLSRKARKALEKLGIEVLSQARVIDISGYNVRLMQNNREFSISSDNILWTAGIHSGTLVDILNTNLETERDKLGRFIVTEDLRIKDRDDIYIAGDIASYMQKGIFLPSVAPVAIQQGRYIGKSIRRRLRGKAGKPFKYFDKGQLAVIGKGKAVTRIGLFKMSGFPAWVIWALVHIAFLIGFDNKILVMFQWAWNYITKKRSARIIFEKLKL